MKKSLGILSLLSTLAIGGCSIIYEGYYEKNGDVSNKDGTLPSEHISDGVTTYPSDTSSYVSKYDYVYTDVASEYRVYASYYSEAYDVIYISYDNKSTPVQTIDSRGLALIEEHLLNYFKSDTTRNDYKEYLKVVRVYPDYISSACHESGASVEQYSKIEGCANYGQLEASVNLNGLVNLERFFNPYEYNDGQYIHYTEPKRDTFAHEFGHVSTFYNLILKGEGAYADYLRLRLGDAYNTIYPSGLPKNYDSNMTYNIQPVEILADDYVELFYDTSEKASNDYNEYTLSYRDLRNSLSGVDNVKQFLKDDMTFYNTIKAYYSNFINNTRTKITPVAVEVTGKVYNNPLDVINDNSLATLSNTKLIAVEEVTIKGKIYYRVVLSNAVKETNVREEYSNNIGYVLKSNSTKTNDQILYFKRYNGEVMDYSEYLPVSAKGVILLPYYDFSYYIVKNNKITVYNNYDSSFDSFELDYNLFK